MPTHRVEVENLAGDQVTVHLYGPQFQTVNEELLQSCFSALLQCAEDNNCFERGLNMACLGTVAAHNAQTQCCEHAFGIAVR